MKNTYLQKHGQNYDLFDAFDDMFRPIFFDESPELRTNIRETDDTYELEIEMPGYEKQNIKVTLENGYLTVSGKKSFCEDNDKKCFIRKEISESCQRSYYIGQNIPEKDVKASHQMRNLYLQIPKDQP